MLAILLIILPVFALSYYKFTRKSLEKRFAHPQMRQKIEAKAKHYFDDVVLANDGDPFSGSEKDSAMPQLSEAVLDYNIDRAGTQRRAILAAGVALVTFMLVISSTFVIDYSYSVKRDIVTYAAVPAVLFYVLGLVWWRRDVKAVDEAYSARGLTPAALKI